MYFEVSDAAMRREREAARELRKSRWWQTLINDARCYYCNAAIARKDVTMDHIVPIAQGGRSTKGNVVPACKDCNNLKRDMTAVEWALHCETLREQQTEPSSAPLAKMHEVSDDEQE